MDVQQLFKNLTKEAECPLCLETVKTPKTLPCLHSFCLVCLDKLAGFARRQLQTTIKCPVCQTSFQIPEGDTFNNLPTSFHLNRLVDLLALRDGSAQTQKCNSCDENNTATCYCFVCQNFLCTSCYDAHQRLKATKGHRNVLIDKLQAQDVEEFINRPVMCSQQYHENQPLEFYCEECKVPICHKCSVVSHNRHTMIDTQKAAQIQKMQMADAMAKVKAETVICEDQIQKQVDLMDKNKHEILFAEKKMTDTVEELIRDLRQHERTMKARLHEIYEAEQKYHATRLENFELHVTQLKSCVERGESILERNISSEILQTNHAIKGRCAELLNARKPEIYKPPHVHYMLENKLNILDRIAVSKTDPSMSSAEGQCGKEVKRNTETNFNVVTRDSDGLQCYHEDDQIKVNILTPAGDQLETEIKDTKDGKYTVTYTPQCAGQHRVEIHVNGQPLTGSPWVVQPNEEIPIQEELWFHGTVDIKNLPRLLKNNGDYLVRESTTKPGQFVLSARFEGLPRHFIVHASDDGLVRFEHHRFPSVRELLDYHVKNQVPVTRKCQATLVSPVNKDKWEMCREDIVLLEQIGEHEFAYVSKGVLKPSNIPVTVKACKENVSQVDKKTFLAEAEILRRYDHPNIVRLIGMCTEKEPVFKVMEFMSGGDLPYYLRDGGAQLDSQKLIQFSVDAAAGMEYLHSKNCIHRDLAARNCYNSNEDVLKISGFHMAREVEGVYEDSDRKIPVRWAAPEVVKYLQYSTLSDVWSFGVLLWEIFSYGKMPYPGINNMETAAKVTAGYHMPPPADTPPSVC